MKSSKVNNLPILREIDTQNPSIPDLLLINHELKRSILLMRKDSLQQTLNINRIHQEKKQLSRELYKKNGFLSLKNNKFEPKTSLPENEPEPKASVPANEPEPKATINKASVPANELEPKETVNKGNGFMSYELELAYRDKLNESEKIKEKYLTKYKNYKKKYPKEDFFSLKAVPKEENNEIMKLLDEKKKMQENIQILKQQLHEITQRNYQIVEENNHFRKEFYDMETKNELLMEELSVLAVQNNELIMENNAFKEFGEKKGEQD